MKAFNPKARREYVLTAERALPADQRTVWVLRPLTVFERAAIMDYGHGDGVGGRMRHAGAIEAVRFGVAGWRNLLDESGQAIEPTFDPDGGLARSVIERLPVAAVFELFAAIMSFETLTEADAGK